MARYHYTRENENGVVLYLESEPAEDAMDVSDDAIAVGFSGNGYLSFWTRCRRAAEALRKRCRMVSSMRRAADA